MNITFRNENTARLFNSEKNLVRKFGAENGRLIMLRMAVLSASPCLDDVPIQPPLRRHQLTGSKDEQFAVDLKHPRRLVFEPSLNPLPRKEDGGLDLKRITAILIVGVEDYH